MESQILAFIILMQGIMVLFLFLIFKTFHNVITEEVQILNMMRDIMNEITSAVKELGDYFDDLDLDDDFDDNFNDDIDYKYFEEKIEEFLDSKYESIQADNFKCREDIPCKLTHCAAMRETEKQDINVCKECIFYDPKK